MLGMSAGGNDVWQPGHLHEPARSAGDGRVPESRVASSWARSRESSTLRVAHFWMQPR